MPSMTKVPRMTFLTNFTSPDNVFRLNASCISILSPRPILRWNPIINPNIIVIIPKPPIWIKNNIIIWPNTLHVDTVGSVTSPVTQTDVVAVKSGTVTEVRTSATYGKVLKYETKDGYTVMYAHLSKVLVKQGEEIRQGQVVAKSGNTGLSTGPGHK